MKSDRLLATYNGKPTKYIRELESGKPQNEIITDINGKRHYTLFNGKPTKYALSMNGAEKARAETQKPYKPKTDTLGEKRKRPFKLRGPRGSYKTYRGVPRNPEPEKKMEPVKVTIVKAPASRTQPEKVTAIVNPEDLKRVSRKGIARLIEKVFGN